jgi:hypothetical protein
MLEDFRGWEVGHGNGHSCEADCLRIYFLTIDLRRTSGT